MAIKLLGHVWRNAATGAGAGAEPRRRGSERMVEAREPSRWNPASLRDAGAAAQAADAPQSEPVWAETEPGCHD